MMNRPRFFRRLVLLLAFAAVFVTGMIVGGNGSTRLAADNGRAVNGRTQDSLLKRDVNVNLYWEVWDEIQKKFVGAPVPETQLFYGSLAGLVRSVGDRYSSFYTPKEADEFDQDLDGEFEGIGAEIGVKRDRIVVIAPLPDSPANKAGLLPGDWIALIDDVPTQGMSLDEAVKKIRGQKGTTVTLEVVRSADSKSQESSHTFAITRDRITVREVEIAYTTTPQGTRVAHVRLYSFNKNAFAGLREASLEIQKKGIESLVFDLRNNGGGLLDQAADIAGLWLPDDRIVAWEAYSGGEKDSLYSGGSMVFASYPTVVLINKGSASASEIVAGALQDYQTAKLVGEKSFGKGSVQTYEKLSDGSALKLTVATWLTPNQRTIDGEGITPDIEVELTEDDFANDRDPQLARALEMLDE